jgi:hypothetical protein
MSEGERICIRLFSGAITKNMTHNNLGVAHDDFQVFT